MLEWSWQSALQHRDEEIGISEAKKREGPCKELTARGQRPPQDRTCPTGTPTPSLECCAKLLWDWQNEPLPYTARRGHLEMRSGNFTLEKRGVNHLEFGSRGEAQLCLLIYNVQ